MNEYGFHCLGAGDLCPDDVVGQSQEAPRAESVPVKEDKETRYLINQDISMCV